MLDATIIPVPIQCNSKKENELIKQGEVPENWQNKPNKLRQKDTDAIWTKKNKTSYFGYKNHTNVDRLTKIITKATTTPASEADINQQEAIIRTKQAGGEKIYKDSGYVSKSKDVALEEQGLVPLNCEKGTRAKTLTDEQNENNRTKSKIRSRVEHVYGAIANEMGGKTIRSIGLYRAECQVKLNNLAYNIKRVETLIRLEFWGGINRISCTKNEDKELIMI